MDPHFPSLLLSFLISLRGLRSTSLSPSGALTAFLFGYLTLALPLRVFGVTLLGFYFAGSKVTKLKHSIKATYEELDKSQQGGGKRNWCQVVCNAAVSMVCAVAWRWWFSGEFTGERGWQDEGKWCIVAANRGEYGVRESSSRALVLIAIAFSSACCGDTFASELGILSTSSPILITRPFSGPVPRGTNGGITLWGLFVSILGGVWVGLLAITTLLLQGQGKTCEEGWWIEVMGVAAFAGLGGSLLDSLLGALFQPTYYSPSRKLVIPNHSSSKKRTGLKDVVRVKGTAVLGNWLSNNGVNFLMGLFTSGIAGVYAVRA
ncbi:hypothetical protein JCM5353_000954 [Sporobolomyces roseus]